MKKFLKFGLIALVFTLSLSACDLFATKKDPSAIDTNKIDSNVIDTNKIDTAVIDSAKIKADSVAQSK
ncbi:MAG: hypothetical protein REI78_00465 [Pedobacter sp.]|nr:hypothetical protein [Pedobacter sp.]